MAETNDFHFLAVDETVNRARSNSGPAELCGLVMPPQITVTADDGLDGDQDEDDELGLLPLPAPRRRANTCPEDMFRPQRGQRPPTPPPSDISPTTAKNRFAFSGKEIDGISFVHHKLSKLTEVAGSLDEDDASADVSQSSESCVKTEQQASRHHVTSAARARHSTAGLTDSNISHSLAGLSISTARGAVS